MSYIYKIINDINNKIYVGKTENSLEQRFNEHCRDSKKEYKNRPLYNAMNKYGIKHFSIHLLEKCNYKDECDREKYWIEYLGTYKYGYNATVGGDGRPYLDYDLVYNLWQQGKTIKEIHILTNYDVGSISKILSNYNITSHEKIIRGKENQIKSIAKIDKNTNKILQVYSSIADAYKDLGKQHSGHIASVCNGKRQTAYGFKWQYIKK